MQRSEPHTNDHTHNRFTDAVYNYINNVNRWSKCSVSYMVCYRKSEMKSLVTKLAISEYVICNVVYTFTRHNQQFRSNVVKS